MRRNRAIVAIALANLHCKREIAAFSGTLLNIETLRFKGANFHRYRFRFDSAIFIDLLMGLFRGAVFHEGRMPENCPLASMERFPSLMGRFPTLMGRFPGCLKGPVSLLKIPWKTAH